MGSKQRNTIIVIGEGITEKHWLLSLKDAYPYFRKVDYVELEHANNMAELEKEIEKAAKMGYAKVFCMIDMDNKKEGVEHEKYMALKRKYVRPIVNQRKGIDCEVRFYETDRCTEQFFLYYFSSTTKGFQSYEDLEKSCAGIASTRRKSVFSYGIRCTIIFRTKVVAWMMPLKMLMLQRQRVTRASATIHTRN